MIRQATTDDRRSSATSGTSSASEIQDAPWRDPDHDEEFERIEKALARAARSIAEDEEGRVGSPFGR